MTINNLVLIGNLVDTPAVQVVPSGASRARFRIASTERRREPGTNTWRDGESVFVTVTCWRKLAENVTVSLEKGDRVIVSGRLRQWVSESDGVRRTVHEIEADAVGPDLLRGVVSVARNRRPEPADVADGGPVGELAVGSDLGTPDEMVADEDGVVVGDVGSGAAPADVDDPASGAAPEAPDASGWLPPLAGVGV
jgi:single-strand DNA-binding protein